MKCAAIRKDGIQCVYNAVIGCPFCRVHSAQLPKMRSREARLERQLDETRRRIAAWEEQAKIWEGNPT